VKQCSEELQRLKPPNRTASMSWLKPRPTKNFEHNISIDQAKGSAKNPPKGKRLC
jgi:hypothetical protein